jgi:hypothetical protein
MLIGISLKQKTCFDNSFNGKFCFSQYVEDDEDEQSEDGDGTVSPRPFDR